MPTVVLRTRTDDDLDVLFSIAADLDAWEERNPWAPGPLTRERFSARLARAADTDAPEANVSFVVDVDGTAVGSASLFEFDSFARHAEAGISLVADARGRGIGTAAMANSSNSGSCVATSAEFTSRRSRRTPPQFARIEGGVRDGGAERHHAWVRGAYEASCDGHTPLGADGAGRHVVVGWAAQGAASCPSSPAWSKRRSPSCPPGWPRDGRATSLARRPGPARHRGVGGSGRVRV